MTQELIEKILNYSIYNVTINEYLNELYTLNLNGRLNRKRYCIYQIYQWIMAIVISTLFSIVGEQFLLSPSQIDSLQYIIYAAIIAWHIPFVVRRYHDIGTDGKFAIINFIPVINIFANIYLFVKKGEPTANAYGEP